MLINSAASLRGCLHIWGPMSVCRRSVLCKPSVNYQNKLVRLSSSKALTDGKNCNCGGSFVAGYPCQVRLYSSAKPKPSPSKSSSLQEVSDSDGRGGAVTLSTAEKVKENVKTVSYGGVIVVGVIIGGAMLYFVLNELFSSESPQNIYSHAFKMCKLSQEVQDALGTPIKCYGEESRRGWRRHVAVQEFLAGDTKYLRMRFYVEGTFKKGTVNVEKKTNDRGKYEYTYITVDVDGYPPRRISVPY